MGGLLIFIGFCAVTMILAMLIMWAGDIVFQNRQFNEACERAMERERIKNLIDNSKIYETMAKIDKMEMKTKSVETAQPVSEPTAADLIIETVKENKW
jgi:predicted negative regulator of RcsB-dependent stress response